MRAQHEVKPMKRAGRCGRKKNKKQSRKKQQERKEKVVKTIIQWVWRACVGDGGRERLWKGRATTSIVDKRKRNTNEENKKEGVRDGNAHFSFFPCFLLFSFFLSSELVGRQTRRRRIFLNVFLVHFQETRTKTKFFFFFYPKKALSDWLLPETNEGDWSACFQTSQSEQSSFQLWLTFPFFFFGEKLQVGSAVRLSSEPSLACHLPPASSRPLPCVFSLLRYFTSKIFFFSSSSFSFIFSFFSSSSSNSSSCLKLTRSFALQTSRACLPWMEREQGS